MSTPAGQLADDTDKLIEEMEAELEAKEEEDIRQQIKATREEAEAIVLQNSQIRSTNAIAYPVTVSPVLPQSLEPPATATTANFTRRGYLSKRIKLKPQYVEHWFVLRDNKLSYFKSCVHKRPLESIDLTQATIQCTHPFYCRATSLAVASDVESIVPTFPIGVLPTKQQRYTFRLTTTNQTFWLRARNYIDMIGWMNDLLAGSQCNHENIELEQCDELIEEMAYVNSSMELTYCDALSTLTGTLNNYYGIYNFTLFSMEKLCVESVLFWTECEGFRLHLHSGSDIAHDAYKSPTFFKSTTTVGQTSQHLHISKEQILNNEMTSLRRLLRHHASSREYAFYVYDIFLSTSAKYRVSVPGTVISSIENRLQPSTAQSESVADDDESWLDLFVHAQNHVYREMSSSIYPEYILSRHFACAKLKRRSDAHYKAFGNIATTSSNSNNSNLNSNAKKSTDIAHPLDKSVYMYTLRHQFIDNEDMEVNNLRDYYQGLLRHHAPLWSNYGSSVDTVDTSNTEPTPSIEMQMQIPATPIPITSNTNSSKMISPLHIFSPEKGPRPVTPVRRSRRTELLNNLSINRLDSSDDTGDLRSLNPRSADTSRTKNYNSSSVVASSSDQTILAEMRRSSLSAIVPGNTGNSNKSNTDTTPSINGNAKGAATTTGENKKEPKDCRMYP